MVAHYFVKLHQFEGPLDLLLQLIQVHELDILTIDLVALTTQYLDHLRLIEFRDMQEAASFIEVAATLIELKAKSILPDAQLGQGKDHERDKDEDPAKTLQERLIQYELFRRAAQFLGERQSEVDVTVSNHEYERLVPEYSDQVAPVRGDLATLLILYEQMLAQIADYNPPKISTKTESLTVEEMIDRTMKLIERVRFTLFQDLYQRLSDRYEFVAQTLAMLQLVRDGKLCIYQEQLMGPIWMFHPEVNPEHLPFKGNIPQPSEGIAPALTHEAADDVIDHQKGGVNDNSGFA